MFQVVYTQQNGDTVMANVLGTDEDAGIALLAYQDENRDQSITSFSTVYALVLSSRWTKYTRPATLQKPR